MALIPLKQTITVYPPGNDDPWNPVPTVPFTLRCRFQEGVEVVTDEHGREVVSSAQIFFDKFPDITAAHTFRYTDESEIERSYDVASIGRKRWLNGKAILTVVYVK
ncbi:hypothetical protein [Paenibacillus sp. PAMC21692]|uniref:hypothetical protein n=1 Tax=Paenibacillus sp. PAMC21692 TaxID=2762320 RepID=UPI00164D857A|nr:hypothetical protein [Paenibacillus sp. PAMC21692]QNK54562.1 hypothetical protein H7F31_18045 [Paenibacillus sp. PAMC21692]